MGNSGNPENREGTEETFIHSNSWNFPLSSYLISILSITMNYSFLILVGFIYQADPARSVGHTGSKWNFGVSYPWRYFFELGNVTVSWYTTETMIEGIHKNPHRHPSSIQWSYFTLKQEAHQLVGPCEIMHCSTRKSLQIFHVSSVVILWQNGWHFRTICRLDKFLRTFMQYRITFCSWPEVAIDM